ncbi:hypothetical protein G6F23_015754 [Rhizopus arrhizus]|nr:hypothetical protein G6F23_015754 [Rhizopus arrhizus]
MWARRRRSALLPHRNGDGPRRPDGRQFRRAGNGCTRYAGAPVESPRRTHVTARVRVSARLALAARRARGTRRSAARVRHTGR